MPDHLFCLCFEGWFFENRDNGSPNGFALSLALSHGEREQMAGNQNNGRTSVICSLSPRERARERAKTVKPT